MNTETGFVVNGINRDGKVVITWVRGRSTVPSWATIHRTEQAATVAATRLAPGAIIIWR